MGFHHYLTHYCGYSDITRLPNGRYAAIAPFMFTHAIIVGRWGDFATIEDRWCYATPTLARAALLAWKPEAEPEPAGWHRHPGSGRRRPEGNARREYVEP